MSNVEHESNKALHPHNPKVLNYLNGKFQLQMLDFLLIDFSQQPLLKWLLFPKTHTHTSTHTRSE